MLDYLVLALEPSGLGDVTAVVSLVASAVAVFTVLYMLRSNKMKQDTETKRLAAEIPFIGSEYIREISEAATVLVVPLRIENDTLRVRLLELENRITVLEIARNKCLEDLGRERAGRSHDQQRFRSSAQVQE